MLGSQSATFNNLSGQHLAEYLNGFATKKQEQAKKYNEVACYKSWKSFINPYSTRVAIWQWQQGVKIQIMKFLLAVFELGSFLIILYYGG